MRLSLRLSLRVRLRVRLRQVHKAYLHHSFTANASFRKEIHQWSDL